MPLVNSLNDPTKPVVEGVNEPAKPQSSMPQTMTTTGMAPTAATGIGPQAQEEDEGVASRVAAITSKGSDYMRQARSDGLRTAAQRGLVNSSIAVGASEDAALRAATPMAAQEAAQAATRNQQRRDIAAQMDRMVKAAGFDKEARGENFGYQTKLNAQQIAAEKDRLTQQLTHATDAQKVEIQSRLQLLDKELAGREKLQSQDNSAQMDRLKVQQSGAMQQLERQIASSEGMQRTELEARKVQMERAHVLELERLSVVNDFNKTMAAIQNGYNVDLTKLQATLQQELQSQANTQALQRMAVEFGNNQQLQSQQNAAVLQQIAARGGQEAAMQAQQLQQAQEQFAASLNQRNSEVTAQAAISVFQAEAGMRQALLSNPNIPASERAAYEQAISQMGGPTREYVSTVLGGGAAPSGGGIAPISGGSTGGGSTGGGSTGGIAPASAGAWEEGALQAMGLGSRGDSVSTLNGHLAGNIEGQLPANVRQRYDEYLRNNPR